MAMTSLSKNSMTTFNQQLRGIMAVITLDRRSRAPIYRQIYDAYRARILRNQLRAGQLVPSSRDLARQLRVSRLPVLNAYAQLLAEGFFETRVGSGTFIAALPSRASTDTRAHVPSGRRRISQRAAALGLYLRPTWAERLGPFQVGQPELQSFPIHIWSRLSARYARELKVRALQYGDPIGLEELREAIATYLRSSRGVRCEASQVMIVNGSQQALDLTGRVLLDPGMSVWMEDPGYWLVHQIVRAAGCRQIAVPVDEEGLDVGAGIKLCPSANAAFVAPSHQYPLGGTMSAARRLKLLDWAHRAEAWIVEDDYDSEYRYDSTPISSLQGLDQHARVIYTSSFSKVLFPSLRIGYLVVPEDLVERFSAMRQLLDLGPSHATQAVLAAFIREGHFSRHLRRMRKLYEERRQVLIESVERELAGLCTVVGANAGMHITLLLNARASDQEMADRAAAKGLIISPLSASSLSRPPRQQGLVLGFGNSRTRAIPQAVHQLKSILLLK